MLSRDNQSINQSTFIAHKLQINLYQYYKINTRKEICGKNKNYGKRKKIYVHGNQSSRIGFRAGYHHVKSYAKCGQQEYITAEFITESTFQKCK